MTDLAGVLGGVLPIVALIGLELAPVAVGMSFFKGGSMASGEIVGSCVLISLFTVKGAPLCPKRQPEATKLPAKPH